MLGNGCPGILLRAPRRMGEVDEQGIVTNHLGIPTEGIGIITGCSKVVRDKGLSSPLTSPGASAKMTTSTLLVSIISVHAPKARSAEQAACHSTALTIKIRLVHDVGESACWRRETLRPQGRTWHRPISVSTSSMSPQTYVRQRHNRAGSRISGLQDSGVRSVPTLYRSAPKRYRTLGSRRRSFACSDEDGRPTLIRRIPNGTCRDAPGIRRAGNGMRRSAGT